MRRLDGPHGPVGVYLIGMFSGTSWRTDDARRAKAARNDRTSLAPFLEKGVSALREKGVHVWLQFLDLPLDRESADDASPRRTENG